MGIKLLTYRQMCYSPGVLSCRYIWRRILFSVSQANHLHHETVSPALHRGIKLNLIGRLLVAPKIEGRNTHLQLVCLHVDFLPLCIIDLDAVQANVVRVTMRRAKNELHHAPRRVHLNHKSEVTYTKRFLYWPQHTGVSYS